jgi:hypothetical protein
MVSIPPNTKMLLSLRNNTLTSEEAIADLIDNSLDQDVGATTIHIVLNKDFDFITVGDNGRGMTRALLVDAMTLGSQGQDSATANDLGLFGIGLKNAAGTLARKLTVITKHEQDIMYTAVYDLDDIVRSGEFSIPIYPSTEDEKRRFRLLTGSTAGTVLIMDKLDGPKISPAKVKSHLGEVFRIFIHNGVTITVNGTALEPVYPLKTTIGEEEVEINDQYYDFKKPDGTPFSLRIRFGFFPPFLKKEGVRHGLNVANQGFYVLRNDRQLERAKWFDIVPRHPDFNRLRGEIYYAGDLDDVFRTNYEKNTLKFDQWFRDALADRLKGLFTSYKQRNRQDYNRGKLNMNAEEAVDYKRIKDDIESKGARIPRLHRDKYLRPAFHRTEDGTSLPEAESGDTQPKKPSKVELIQFATGRLEASRICLFEDVGNGALQIRFNVDHPFYSFFVAQAIEVKDVFAKLLFVLGRSILIESDTDEKTVLLDGLQCKFGDEYRKLLE